jgi:hypothetical protein
MNLEEARKIKAGTKVMFDAEVWDFGYVGHDGRCILYVEGECNMQDAIAVEPALVELETVARARMARCAKENPALPPGWEWPPRNGRDDVQIKWRALGPTVACRRLKAYGEHEDSPGAASDKVRHGPGHQSKTRCRVVGPHAVHEAVYGRVSTGAPSSRTFRGGRSMSDQIVAGIIHGLVVVLVWFVNRSWGDHVRKDCYTKWVSDLHCFSERVGGIR